MLCRSNLHPNEKCAANTVQGEVAGNEDLESVLTLTCLLAYLVIDHNQLNPVDVRVTVLDLNRSSQLPPRIPETTNFSHLGCFQHGAAAIFEVPVMVVVVTLSIPILPLLQYCVGTAIFSCYANTGMFQVFASITNLLH